MTVATLAPKQREFLKAALLAAWMDGRRFNAAGVCDWLGAGGAEGAALLAWAQADGLVAAAAAGGGTALTDAGAELAAALREQAD